MGRAAIGSIASQRLESIRSFIIIKKEETFCVLPTSKDVISVPYPGPFNKLVLAEFHDIFIMQDAVFKERAVRLRIGLQKEKVFTAKVLEYKAIVLDRTSYSTVQFVRFHPQETKSYLYITTVQWDGLDHAKTAHEESSRRFMPRPYASNVWQLLADCNFNTTVVLYQIVKF